MENFWNVTGLDGYTIIQLPSKPNVGDTLDLYEYYWAGGTDQYIVEHIDEYTQTITLKPAEHIMT